MNEGNFWFDSIFALGFGSSGAVWARYKEQKQKTTLTHPNRGSYNLVYESFRTFHLQEKERELEELKRTNPELALEEMEKLERTRIAERATLKHRNSSKYLQMQSRRVEYFWLLSTLYS